MWNHYQLRWQYDWRGTKLLNTRFLVCPDCYDEYQQNGQRTIILPADPVPIMNSRPEQYVPADNPLSANAANPTPTLQPFSGQIGTMTKAAGIPAAFDGNANKPSFMSAMVVTPDSSFGNYVGINWAGYPAGTFPPGLDTPVITHTLGSFTITAPNDSIFGSSAWAVQGSLFGSNSWALWVTLASGATLGAVGEVISGSVSLGGRYQFHRAAFSGASGRPIAVAQVSFSVVDGSSTGEPA
jgi:hypothetical protein